MTRPHRIAVSGCGAVTELYYAPALRDLERRGRVRVIGLFDPDDASFARIARSFSAGRRSPTFASLLAEAPDLVIVASPPRLHAEQSIAALDAGAAVLCEKPMALSSAEGITMENAARTAARTLAVGMVRRHFPAARLVKELLDRSQLGAPRGFTYFEGGVFRWPVRSADYFDRAQSGGGVLIDIGVHVLDLLSWWLESVTLRRASDDAMGGVEANSLLEVECEGGVEGTIRLSRDWARPNELILRADRGVIRWRLDEIGGVDVEHADGSCERIGRARNDDVRFEECFAAQLRTVLRRLDDPTTEVVGVTDLLPTVAVIEQAYATRVSMPMAWMAPPEGRRVS